MFTLDHSDHVQIVRCISALKEGQENSSKSCLTMVERVMPEGYMPLITTYFGGLWDMIWIYCP